MQRASLHGSNASGVRRRRELNSRRLCLCYCWPLQLPARPAMLPIPADIFTEPEDVSPDALANLGPLRRLAGVWQSDHEGVDVSPKAAGPERRIYREQI